MAVSFPFDGLKICEPLSAGNSSPAMKWPTCFILASPTALLCDCAPLPHRPARSYFPIKTYFE
jgi:hypothetical protein